MELTNISTGKIPPHDTELERAVLGVILLHNEAFDIVSGIVTSTAAFYDQKHALIFEVVKTLIDSGNPADLLTVTEGLRKISKLDDVGGVFYITKMTMDVVGVANVEVHARLLQEKYIKREAIRLGYGLVSDGFNDEVDALELADNAEKKVFELGVKNSIVNYANGAALARLFNDFYSNRGNGLIGISTGFKDLDALLNGWKRKTLNIIAARPSVGKTSFLVNTLLASAINGKPCAAISLETSNLSMAMRFVLALAEVDNQKVIKNQLLTTEEKGRIQHAMNVLSKLPIYITDQAGMNITQFKSFARLMRKKHGVELFGIDYIQLMEGTGREANRNDVVGGISRGLKVCAMELDVPIIALSQLNRNAENSPIKEPQMKDLRESGSIEQDADTVTFITRTDYQADPNSPLPIEYANDAKLHVKKNKDGATDNMLINFVKSIGKWFDYHGEEYNKWLYSQKNQPEPQPYTPPIIDNPRAGFTRHENNFNRNINFDEQ